MEEEINGDGQEPDLYIFYPVGEDDKSGDSEERVSTESFRGIYKIGVQVPLKRTGK